MTTRRLRGSGTTTGSPTHQLGNLLAIALGQAEYLLSEGDEVPLTERRDALELIRNAIVDARDVVRDGVQAPSAPAAPSRVAMAPASRVLVIDDDEDVRDTLVELLSQAGHTVEAAADGAEGIRRYREGAFDSVLVDLGMPGVTGLVVSRVIKDHDPRAYVVLMTGSESGLDARQLQAAAVDRVMVKPPTRAELLAAVRA